MICRYCGKEIADGTKFCENCGANLAAEAPQPVPQGQNFQGAPAVQPGYPQPVPYNSAPAPKKKNTLATVIAAIIVIGLVIFVISRFSSDVYKVKNGSPNSYPNKTWGDALDDVCKKGKWKAYKEDGERYVKYTGTTKSDGKKLEKIFLIKDSKTFTVDEMKYDGSTYDGDGLFSNYGMVDMIDKIFTGSL